MQETKCNSNTIGTILAKAWPRSQSVAVDATATTAVTTDAAATTAAAADAAAVVAASVEESQQGHPWSLQGREGDGANIHVALA